MAILFLDKDLPNNCVECDFRPVCKEFYSEVVYHPESRYFLGVNERISSCKMQSANVEQVIETDDKRD